MHLELRLSEKSFANFDDLGFLKSITSGNTGWEFIPSPGWSLLVQVGDDLVTALPHGKVEVNMLGNEHAMSLRYRQVRAGDIVLPADVEVRWTLRDDLLSGKVNVMSLDPSLTLEAICLPDIILPCETDADVIVPKDIGWLLKNAFSVLFGNLDSPGEYVMHGDHIQMSAWIESTRSFYMDCRDTTGWTRRWNWLKAGDRQIRIRIDHLAPRPESSTLACFEMPYPVNLGARDGHWFSSASTYRQWALNQSWASRGRKQRSNYIGDIACWLWNRGSAEHVTAPAIELSKRLELPVALDWYWWHKHPYDTGYPEYFPPREGTERFMQVVKDFRKTGNFVQVYTNGMSWDMTLDSWDEGKSAALVTEDGSYWNVTYNTWVNRPLAHMCGRSKQWHDVVLGIAKQAHELGLNGLYLDQISCTGSRRPCFATNHDHQPGGGNYIMAGWHELLEKIRRQFPDLVLSSEGTKEHLLGSLDGGITLSTSFERVRMLPDPLRASSRPIPLAQAVYHGRGVHFGNVAILDGIPPYDEFWPPKPYDGPEQDWVKLCPDQFAFELSRTLVFGIEPMVAKLTMDHLQDERYAEDIDFLVRLCRFYHAHRDWLLWGTMLHPGECRCKRHDLASVTRDVFTPPEKAKITTRDMPGMLHSLWRSDEGESAVVLVNYSREDRSFSLIPADDLTVKTPTPSVSDSGDGVITGTVKARDMLFVPLRAR